MADVYDRKEIVVEREDGAASALTAVLIIILIGLIAWFAVSWDRRARQNIPDNNDLNIKVDLPDNTSSPSGNTTTGGTTSGGGSGNTGGGIY